MILAPVLILPLMMVVVESAHEIGVPVVSRLRGPVQRWSTMPVNVRKEGPHKLDDLQQRIKDT